LAIKDRIVTGQVLQLPATLTANHYAAITKPAISGGTNWQREKFIVVSTFF
jgi:hypothetical protein